MMAFGKIVMAYAFTGLVLNNLLLVFLIEWFEIDELLAPIINIAITTPINYLLNKRYAFKDSGKYNMRKK